MQRRALQKDLSRTPSLPTTEPPPLNEPPYEVIEFPTQQYSNTPSVIQNKLEQKKQEIKRKCDLCGSSSAQFHCDHCSEQAFCVSCDLMYHRHPKRQTHVRKRLPTTERNNSQPPIPPKGELSTAPVPPPRRNKRANKESLRKNGSIMGSLKRFVGIPPVATQFQSRNLHNDSRPPKFAHNLHSLEIDKQPIRRDMGYLDWELENRNRAGSFAALNAPGFSPLIQAQSMAQLNCPSCHHHGMSTWDWNRSQMNLNAFQQPWPGMSTGTWHGSVMFPPPYRMPENFSDHSSRRSSIRHQRYNRKPSKFNESDNSESDLSLSDDRKSRRRSPPASVRGASPALSRKSRRTIASDSEEEVMSRKSDRTSKRRIPASRDASPAVFRRTFRKKLDDDTMSMKSTSSRKSRKSPMNSKSSPYLKKNIPRSSSDSDDELTSEREANSDQPRGLAFMDEVEGEPIKQVAAKKENNRTVPKTRISEKIKNYEKMRLQAQDNNSKNVKKVAKQLSTDDANDWECEHCTYLNVGSSRVCDVCCKSRNSEKSANEESLVESMKTLNVSPADGEEKKKGEQNDDNRLISNKRNSGTSPPPQSASTQTYEIPSTVAKRNRSLSFDDYSDWNPNKKSSSATSFTSDNQSSSINRENSPQFSEQNSLQKQMKDGMEIVKLLKEAEKHRFGPDDLTIALMHCGEINPVKWLLENWNKMIETVVTLATNYGHEQPENIIGTISFYEAKAALHLHNGEIWAAATECIRQRQRKYAKLMSKGNFTREDVVTVLTANHGDIEKAYMELRKSQLKPFLMKIWGPPQGIDNESGNTTLHSKVSELSHSCNKTFENNFAESDFYNSNNNFNFVQSWLKTVNSHYQEDTNLIDFMKIKSNLRNYASSNHTYKSLDRCHSKSHSESYSSSDETFYPKNNINDSFLRYRSCENLNDNNKKRTFSKRFYKSSESLFRNKTKLQSDTNSGFFLHESDDHDLPNDAISNRKTYSFIGVIEKINENNLPKHHSQNYVNFDNNIQINSSPIEQNSEFKIFNDHWKNNNPLENTKKRNDHDFNNFSKLAKEEIDIFEENVKNIEKSQPKYFEKKNSSEEDISDDSLGYAYSSESLSSFGNEDRTDIDYTNRDGVVDEVEINDFLDKEEVNFDTKTSNVKDEKKDVSCILFQELKALFLLAKHNLEFLVISNNDASLQLDEYKNVFNSNISSKEDELISNDVNKFKNKIDNTENLDQGDEQKSFKDIHKASKKVEYYSMPSSNSNRFVSKTNLIVSEDATINNDSAEEQTPLRSTPRSAQTDENIEINGANAQELDEDISEKEKDSSDSSEFLDLSENTNDSDFIIVNNKKYTEEPKLNENFRDFSSNTQQFIDPERKNIAEYSEIAQTDVTDNVKNAEVEQDSIEYEKSNNAAELTSQSYGEDSMKNEINPTNSLSSNVEIIKFEKNGNNYQKNKEISDEEKFEDKTIKKNENTIEIEKIDQETLYVGNLEEMTNTEDSFSEYIREIITTDNTDNKPLETDETELEINDTEKSTQKGYLSDSSEDSFKVEVQNCLSEGISSYDQAVLAAQLIKLKFDRSQSLEAAKECSNIHTAITYLQQECELCAEKFSIKQMISMLECEHRCCENCAEQFFSLQISEKSIMDCVCPFCKQPQISSLNSDKIMDYFSNLDILLKTILQPNIHELFQRKLRDRTLMQDPHFQWCSKCSSGFIADPQQKWVFCPDCKFMSCVQCGKPWDKVHDGKTCEQYKSWMDKNDPSSQLSRCLEDYGITCPKCDTKFILIKGGCMHLTCTNCKYEFCSDCLKPFAMGTTCQISDYCAKLGLHAHHPRNCLFYLRDKEPEELRQLLKDNNVQINLTTATNPRCNIQLQKETEDGLIDTICGARVEEAGLCRTHFIEYLTALIRKNKIDPIVIFDLAEVLQEFRRRGKSLPIRSPNIFEHEYRRHCIKIVKEEMPLE